MKKVFLLIASAALLFAGCTKEPKLVNAVGEGETVTLTVTAMLENANPATKASWDNDGNGAKVNHWIMEIYNGTKLYDRQEKKNQSGLTNTFEVTLFKNQTYEFAFWADSLGAYNTEDLKKVTMNYTEVGLDGHDAFFANVQEYVSEKSETLKATLHRPLAQLNIVTRDLKKIFAQMTAAGTTGDYAKFIPVDLVLKGDIFNQFNAFDSTVTDQKTTTLNLAKCYADYMAHKDTTTIFMCYGFVKPEKELYNFEFSYSSNNVGVSYTFDNIPLQRNYRTNISGNLLSNDSQWDVTIDPEWDTPEYENIPVQSVTFDKTSMNLPLGGEFTLTATVYPSNATDPKLTWTSSNEDVATVDETGKVKAVAEGTAVITATASNGYLFDNKNLPSASCTVTVEYANVVIAGLKWATCNIGATVPTEAGWYFSWGNTVGYIFNSSKWVLASDGTTPLGADGMFTSDNYAGTPGEALAKDITPDSGNDAARVNMGGKWRMPTAAEFQKLYEACGGEGTKKAPTALATATPEKGIYWLEATQKYIAEYEGVAGVLFVDADKTQLFFPITGFGDATPDWYYSVDGRYWSSTYYYNSAPEKRRNEAKFLYFHNKTVQPQFCYRGFRGYAIRAVKDID